MGISFIFSALFVLLLVAGIVYVAWRWKEQKKLSIVGVTTIALALLCLIIIPGCFHTVEAGQIAVVKHLGEARAVRTASV